MRADVVVLEFRLTDAHIREGEPGGCTTCPVALALRDVGIFASVRRFVVHAVKKGFSLDLMIHHDVRGAIAAYDDDAGMSAATLQIVLYDAHSRHNAHSRLQRYTLRFKEEAAA